MELDVPDAAALELKCGAPGDQFVFYALKGSAPATWDEFRAGGLWICADELPLIPTRVQGMLHGGGFLPGTVLTLSSDDFESVAEGTQSALGMKIMVTIGITYDGCIDGARQAMAHSRGVLLLTDRSKPLHGDRDFVEVNFR
jgi:hypothetical protein